MRQKIALVSWFVCLSLIIGTVFPPNSSAVVESPKKIDVVNLQLAGRLPNASIAELRSGIISKVIPLWNNQNVSFELGEIGLSPTQFGVPLYCSGNQITSFMISLRKSYYEQRGLGEAKNRVLVALAPRFGCIWEGISLIAKDANAGGVVILQDTVDPFIVSHELGHALGLGHSNLLQCTSGAKDGPWSNDCKGVEYGGAVDLMSNVENNLPLSTYHKWRLGLISNAQIKQNWIDELITLENVTSRQGTLAIFIRDERSTYWIELRKASIENGYQAGLVIYRTDPPPPNFISSPNPEDTLVSEANSSVSTDIWLLNLDNYKYSQGRVSGSMALPTSRTFTTHSGNVTITALLSSDTERASVQILRKKDITPPRKPTLTDKTKWNSPETPLITEEYLNSEFDIKEFEIRTNQKTQVIKTETSTSWNPTFLNPINPSPQIKVGDLPEGKYLLSIRSIDYFGNIGPWSDQVDVFIDRSYPKVSNEFSLVKFGQNESTFQWNGTIDEGSGLCETRIINEDDFIVQRDISKTNPNLRFVSGQTKLNAEVFDCLGNGIKAKLSAFISNYPATKTRRTSKWAFGQELDGLQQLYCPGTCSASISVSNNFSIIFGSGGADVLLSGKRIGTIAQSRSSTPRVGFSGKVNSKSQVLRISGKNFSFYGVATSRIVVDSTQNISRKEIASDASLRDQKQVELQKRGLNSGDFAGDWNLLPMARGTTLDDPTLDLCSPKYDSDSNRIERRQVTVFKDASPYLFLSNEVVRYRDVVSANLAFNELEEAVSRCRNNGGGVDISGIFAKHDFLELPTNAKDRRIGSKKVFVRVTIGTGSEARSLLGLYQFNRDLFSGLYVVKIGTNGFTDAEVLRWLDVASVIETRLTAVN
jgi:hypothetical protein